jgi:beta-lactamase class A
MADDESADGLAGRVDALLMPYLSVYGDEPPTVSVRFAGLDGAVRFDRAATAVHVTASLMKVPVALAVLRLVDAGRLSLDDEIEVRNGFPAALGGTFELDGRDDADAPLYGRVGRTASVGDLLHRMISISSNLATDLLLDLTSPEDVTAAAHQVGAGATYVRRYLCDEAAGDAGIRNTTTAADSARLMAAVARGETLSPQSCQVLLRALREQAYNSEIPAGLPPGTTVAHKTGWVSTAVHDMAVVEPAGRAPFVLAVLTSDFVDAPTAGLLISRIARECWDAWHD